MKKLAWSVLSIAAFVSPVFAQPTPRPRAEVLVLGVYHMANPGHDVFNLKADDVLAPQRQEQLKQLSEVLRRFHPNKVAVESDVYSKRAANDYAEYLAGKHELTRNEIEQIGFRVAKDAGLMTIYAVDVDGDFPYQRVLNYAKGSGHEKEFQSLTDEIGKRVHALNDYMGSHTILETLLYVNSDEWVRSDSAFYYQQVRFGEAGDWAGADLVADWYRRNMRIYSNILQLVTSPDDRILVIYGYGHLPWLQQAVAGNPDLRLRKLVEFAK